MRQTLLGLAARMVRRWINIFPEVIQFFVGIQLLPLASGPLRAQMFCSGGLFLSLKARRNIPTAFERRTNLRGSRADPSARCLEDCRINMKWFLLLSIRTAYTHNTSGVMVRNWFVLIGPNFLMKVHCLLALIKVSSLCLQFKSYFLELIFYYVLKNLIDSVIEIDRW